MTSDELKEILEQYDKAQGKHKTNYISMEEAMKDDFMRKAIIKHQRKMKRQQIMAIAMVLLILAALSPIIIYYFYDKYLLIKRLPELIPFFKEQPVFATLSLLISFGFAWFMYHLKKKKRNKKKHNSER